jgi:hypothetical protein
MRFSTTILASILSVLATQASAGCSYESGNYFCDEVSAIKYSNVGYSGTYKDVTNMDESSCKCTQESVSFSGTNAPLDEELSIHFRGPVKLLQFAAYYPSSSKSKRDAVAEAEPCAEVKHIHHQHKREPATEIVQVTQTVYVNAKGEVVTKSASVASSETAQTVSTTTLASSFDGSITSGSTSTSTSTSGSGSTSSSSSSAAASSSSSASGSDWSRQSYYTPGSTDNVVFLNTKGGSSSGTWSSCFGNSLSYAGSNGVDAVSSATALDEVTLKSDEEYVIFSGESCSSGKSSQGTECGYYRSDIPAYHGFGGSEKIFLFEFEMPTDSSSSGASNPDMPAIWLLNAKIPRTLQYGDASCSCWSTGCGELDLFEILAEGDDKLISHIHDGQGNDGTQTGGGGSQDYFKRPTSGSFKGAVIFNSDKTIQIAQVDDADFSSGLSSSQVSEWLAIEGGTAKLS